MTTEYPIHFHLELETEFRAHAVRKLRSLSVALPDLQKAIERVGFDGYRRFIAAYADVAASRSADWEASCSERRRFEDLMSGMFRGASELERRFSEEHGFQIHEAYDPRKELIPREGVDNSLIASVVRSLCAEVEVTRERLAQQSAADQERDRVYALSQRLRAIVDGFQVSGLTPKLVVKPSARRLFQVAQLDERSTLAVYFNESRGLLAVRRETMDFIDFNLRAAVVPAAVFEQPQRPAYVCSWKDRVALPMEQFLDGFRCVHRCANLAQLEVVSLWFGAALAWVVQSWSGPED